MHNDACRTRFNLDPFHFQVLDVAGAERPILFHLALGIAQKDRGNHRAHLLHLRARAADLHLGRFRQRLLPVVPERRAVHHLYLDLNDLGDHRLQLYPQLTGFVRDDFHVRVQCGDIHLHLMAALRQVGQIDDRAEIVRLLRCQSALRRSQRQHRRATGQVLQALQAFTHIPHLDQNRLLIFLPKQWVFLIDGDKPDCKCQQDRQ